MHYGPSTIPHVYPWFPLTAVGSLVGEEMQSWVVLPKSSSSTIKMVHYFAQHVSNRWWLDLAVSVLPVVSMRLRGLLERSSLWATCDYVFVALPAVDLFPRHCCSGEQNLSSLPLHCSWSLISQLTVKLKNEADHAMVSLISHQFCESLYSPFYEPVENLYKILGVLGIVCCLLTSAAIQRRQWCDALLLLSDYYYFFLAWISWLGREKGTCPTPSPNVFAPSVLDLLLQLWGVHLWGVVRFSCSSLTLHQITLQSWNLN